MTPEKPRPPQLRIYIGGIGGTGKTQIVNAVRELFQRGKADWLHSSYFTGTAAKDISGSTYFSLLGINPVSGARPQLAEAAESAVERKQVAREERAAALDQMKFIIMDEVSMVVCHNFASIDQQLKSIKQSDAQTDWAGVHFIALGDFSQLRPVGGTSLADLFAYKPKGKLSPVQQGRALWDRFDKVILATQQMRLLERLRNGSCSCCCCDDQDNPSHSRCKKKPQSRKCKRETGDDTCDHHMLMERVLDPKAANGQRDKWRDSRMLCCSNPVSAAWSRDDIMSLAARTRQPVLVSVADDERSTSSSAQSQQRRLRPTTKLAVCPAFCRW